ncbi:MAG TPA: UPF0149 family protein [Candidatus Baltobacteraceae bacterium]|jgi:uncharacterized protein|nr:UPF0149 family protein [Candidatus Baltobacteraceae bacterium]
MDLKRRLTKKERDELEGLMEVRDPHFAGPMQGSITRVHGFLTSIVSGPIVMPSEWIPVIFGDEDAGPWETMEQAQRAMTLIMRFYNEIASDLGPGRRRYSILIDRIGDRPDTLDLADDWCRGYMLGLGLRGDEWKEALDAPELRNSFMPILLTADSKKSPALDPFENPETYAALLDHLPDCAVEIHEWWRAKLVASMAEASHRVSSTTVRRDAPKVSANAPCPCGSGKKYKRCCSSLRVV